MAYGAVEDCTKGTIALQHVGVNIHLLQKGTMSQNHAWLSPVQM